MKKDRASGGFDPTWVPLSILNCKYMRLPGDLSEARTATQVFHINKTRLKSLPTDVENPVICSRWARRAGTMQWGRFLSQRL